MPGACFLKSFFTTQLEDLPLDQFSTTSRDYRETQGISRETFPFLKIRAASIFSISERRSQFFDYM